MSLIFDGEKIEIPNLQTISYLDKKTTIINGKEREMPYFGPAQWKTRRKTWVRGIVVHTNRGRLPVHGVRSGGEDKKRDIALARYQDNTTRKVSWDYTTDFDGSIACSNDPWDFYTWHAGSVNRSTVGIEMVQETRSPWTLYHETLDSTVLLIDILTNRLGIQRQVLCYDKNRNNWHQGVMSKRLQRGHGYDMIGIYGHRNITKRKGPGDPGNIIFDKLHDAGYEILDAEEEEDKALWAFRQRELDIAADGLPGPATRRALARSGKAFGLYVHRPIDDLFVEIDRKLGYPDSDKLLREVPFER